MVVVLGATTFVVHKQTDDPVLIAYWWFGMLVISFCVVAFVVGRRYLNNEPAPGRVLCIVPTYNEPTEHLHACIESLLAQDMPLDIHVIDDGSQVPAEVFHHPRVTWHTQANTGKRGAQVTVLRRIAEDFGEDFYEYVLTVDSDSRPYPSALRELLKAMNQGRTKHGRRIWAATGMIYIRNYGDSIVSRAADMDIGSSCVMMRASRSMLGALETTSGALAIYPTELLYNHLEAYAVECGTGDDRWLALRALERGEVVGVAEAGVVTEMPTTLKGTYKQRLRWARSWWWMLPYVFRNLSFKQLISPLYGLTQLVVAPAMMIWAVVGFILSAGQRYEGSYAVLFMYIGAYGTVRFGLSGLYLVGRPDMPRKEKLKSFFGGTVAAILLNVFWLMPVRYWALFKLRDNRWQTRDLKPTTGKVYRSRRWYYPRLAAAGLLLLAGIGISMYALTGGKDGPAKTVLNAAGIVDADPAPRKPYVPPATVPSARPKQEITQQPVPQQPRTTSATPDRAVPRRTQTASKTPTPTRSTPTPVPTRVRPSWTPSRPVPKPKPTTPSGPPSTQPSTPSSVVPSIPIVLPSTDIPAPDFSAPIIVPSS